MIRAARRHPWLTLGLALAITLALVFAVRTVLLLAGWGPDPARPVEGWMTPRYLVRVYGIEPDRLAPVLGIEPGSAPRDPLTVLATRQGIPLPDLLARVEALRAGSP